MLLKTPTSIRGISRWAGVAFLLTALFLGLAVLSYDPNDLAFFTTNVNDPLKNYAGVFGSWIAFFLFMLFGVAAYLLPVIGLMIAVSALSSKEQPHLWKKLAMGLAFAGLSALLLATYSIFRFDAFLSKINIPSAGGLVGQRIANDILARYIGGKGTLLLLFPLWALSGILFFDIPWRRCFEAGKEAVLKLPSLFTPRTRRIPVGGRDNKIHIELPRVSKPSQPEAPSIWKKAATPVLTKGPIIKNFIPPIPKMPAKAKETVPSRGAAPAAAGKKPVPKKAGVHQLPTLQLLENPRELAVTEKDGNQDFQQKARILEATLRDFGIDAEVVEVHPGPVITRYEVQPAPGVKVNRITALSDDIALAMKAPSIRIVAPIPGKAAVGIEVPNSKSVIVTLKELLVSDEFEISRAKIPLALGKDVSGKPLVADLTEMPHLLVAGSTGSGKSVFVNSIILSILYTLTPEQCKLLLVDPKMVELTAYKELPHLIGPVVTDPKKVSGALFYAIREMEKRYKILAEVGVRNINDFNNRPNKDEVKPPPIRSQKDGEEDAREEDEPIPATLPYIVIIIDELADLMMVAPTDIESAIARLTQMARAVGIHVILATQRPSVDVITGVIKANLPARISFQVASKVDSRTILDANGADKLLGKGDMLFLPPGTSKLVRAQGTWVSDAEIRRVTNFIKDQGAPVFEPDIFEPPKKSGAAESSFDDDELYDEAVEIVMHTQQASASILQRRLRVGYARAARLIDMMEENGIVGAFRGSKARDILVKSPAGEGGDGA